MIASTNQNADVVSRRGLVWSRNDRIAVAPSSSPIRTQVASRSWGPMSLIDRLLSLLGRAGQPLVEDPEVDAGGDGRDHDHRQGGGCNALGRDVVPRLLEGPDDQQHPGG